MCSNLAVVQILFIYTYIREASTQKTRGISPPPARLVYILAAAVPVGASQAGSPRVKIKSKCYDIIWRSFSFSFSLHTFRHQMVSPSISHLMLGKEEERKKEKVWIERWKIEECVREAFPYMAATITPIAAETRNFISRRPNLESGNYTRGSREKRWSSPTHGRRPHKWWKQAQG